jgi:hypothetical protein
MKKIPTTWSPVPPPPQHWMIRGSEPHGRAIRARQTLAPAVQAPEAGAPPTMPTELLDPIAELLAEILVLDYHQRHTGAAPGGHARSAQNPAERPADGR